MKNQIIALIIALIGILLAVIFLIIGLTYYNSIYPTLFSIIGIFKFLIISILQIIEIVKMRKNETKCGS